MSETIEEPIEEPIEEKKTVNIALHTEALRVLKIYQAQNSFSNQDAALNSLLIKHKEQILQSKTA